MRYWWLAAVLFLSCSGAQSTSSLSNGWIDRIEDDIAVVVVSSAGGYVERLVPLSDLPDGVREGDVLVDGRPDPFARAALARRVRTLQGRLFGRADAGDR